MLFGAQIVVIVPAFEEAPRIGRVLASMPVEVDRVVVIDDASRDRTSDAAREHGDPRVVVLRHAKNLGVGAAIASGYREAMARPGSPHDAFVVMAGDAQMDPRDLPRVAGPVARREAGYVKGDRFGDPNVLRVMPPARWLGGHVLSWMTSRAIGQRVRDSQCGYTAIARWACERLDLDALWPRYGYPNDLLAQLARREIPILEAPVRPIYADEESKLRARHLIGVARVVVRAWLRRDPSVSRRMAPPRGMR
jgi:glycosyltransferase involved in cell wall biosynthesis